MSEKHRTVLRSKRPELLKSVIVGEPLLSKLISDGTINQTTKEDIDVSYSTVSEFTVCVVWWS